MNYIDISPLISKNIQVWPGDVPFELKNTAKIEEGSSVELNSISTTLHVGAHVDAPLHFSDRAADISKLDLTPYIGLCQVIKVMLPKGERIFSHHVEDSIKAPRVLFRTDSFPDPNKFNQDFNSLSPELIDWLKTREVVLVGIDTPSVDPFNDKKLETHHSLLKNNIRNIEGIVLKNVESGIYNLVALPLLIDGGDASPVRAILMEELCL